MNRQNKDYEKGTYIKEIYWSTQNKPVQPSTGRHQEDRNKQTNWKGYIARGKKLQIFHLLTCIKWKL